jgi:hypothetical protein
MRVSSHVHPVGVLGEPDAFEMQSVEDHRGGLIGVPPEDGGGEWQERDEEELQDVEQERGARFT